MSSRKSASVEYAFYDVLTRFQAIIDCLEDDTILDPLREDHSDSALEEALSLAKDGLYAIKFERKDRRGIVNCDVCGLARPRRDVSEYRRGDNRKAVCLKCEKDIVRGWLEERGL